LLAPPPKDASHTGDDAPEHRETNRTASPLSTKELRARHSIIGIASSTGGPSALVTALKPLPASYPLPILIVQHITHGFTTGFCEWLNSELNLQVLVAQQGAKPLPGQALVAPDDMHMQISDQGTVVLHTSPPYKGLRPSANYLFYSLARVYGRQATGVILTGMGDDGADGLKELHDQGGLCIAQNEETSVVFGMPREAIARKAIDHVLPIENVSQVLLKLLLS
jgi:two-component system chemotaxis response regulator CheB